MSTGHTDSSAETPEVDRPGSDAPEISVVVCTYRRAAKLSACLDALARQTIRRRAEVIVVDDGPDDATAAVAGRYEVQLLQHTHNRGPAAARNTGICAASAPVVAFTDDDCVPANGWMEALLKPYEHPGVVAVGGLIEALRTETIVHRYLAESNRLAPLELELGQSSSLFHRARHYIKRNFQGTQTQLGTRPVFSLVGANSSFRRDALFDVGLFDDDFDFAGGEDEDLCRRLRALFPSDEIVFTSCAVVAHDYDGELRDTLRRSYQYGRASARGCLTHDDQSPTLFPAPALVASLLALGSRRPWALAAAAAVPFVVSPVWSIEAIRRRRPDLLAFPAVQLLEEAANDLGFVRDWLRLHRQLGARPDQGAVGG
jgi:glycosyltransferase involved in cell wall biosynthesis